MSKNGFGLIYVFKQNRNVEKTKNTYAIIRKNSYVKLDSVF